MIGQKNAIKLILTWDCGYEREIPIGDIARGIRHKNDRPSGVKLSMTGKKINVSNRQEAENIEEWLYSQVQNCLARKNSGMNIKIEDIINYD